MQSDDLSRYLDSLERDQRYTVVETIKASPFETTERVMLASANGEQAGPYIRKTIERESGMGGAYERIFEAQQQGMHFEHIPRVVDCFLRDNQIVVVTEFVNGLTLLDLVYEQDPSVALAARVFPQLCDAVIEMHERFDPPIIHRDLKPSNAIVADDTVTIIDFGIAREFKESASSDTTQFGTRSYAPPEQFGFGQTTVKSDVYALGMLLYFLLTEKNPSPKTVEKRFKDADIPEALRSVIDTATAFDPARRFESVRTLKAAFEQCILEAGPAKRTALPDPSLNQPPRTSAPHASTPAAPSHSQANMAAEIEGGTAMEVVGKAWNVVLFAVYGFFILSCVGAFLNVVEQAQNPMWYNVLAYLVFMPALITAVGYTLADKRRLKKRYPQLARLKLWHLMGLDILLVMILMILVRVMNLIAGV